MTRTPRLNLIVLRSPEPLKSVAFYQLLGIGFEQEQHGIVGVWSGVMAEEQVNNRDGIWCIVANIKKEHPFGPGGDETKIGTRQFRGGTKVYIAGCWPGTCDAVVCIGLHRKSRRFISCTVDVRWVENFRVKLVYHPRVLELIESDERCWIRTEEEARTWAAAFPEWQKLWEKPLE